MGGWTLADPIACPGLFDLLAIIASRTWRDVPLGSMLAAANAVAIVLALVLLARAFYISTSSVVVTIAITLAASASLLFTSELAPSAAAAFVATIAAWQTILKRPGLFALLALALVATTVPPMMLPAAIIAACISWSPPPPGLRWASRWHLRVGAVAVVLGVSHLMQMAMPHGHSCVIPHGGWASLTNAVSLIASAAREAGPLASALALLGLFAIKRLPRDVALSIPVLVLVSVWGAALSPDRSAWVLAPFVIACWLLAAAGLAEMWESAGGKIAGKAGVAALSIALIVLQMVTAGSSGNVKAPPDGHERLTLAMMSAIVGALPRGAALVEEDAITGLLARALPSRVRTSDRFQIVPRNASAITDALGRAPVFALPRSQRVLQHLGFEMAGAENADVPGLAEIRQAHTCTAELGTAPVLLSRITGGQGLALVAGNEGSLEMVVIVLAGEVPIPVSPVGWPPNALRGFGGRMFDLTATADQRDFAEELRSYALSSWSVPNTRYVSRIEIWRTPGAPLVLPLALGGTVSAGTARVTGTSPDQHLRLCPSIPYEVRSLVRRP